MKLHSLFEPPIVPKHVEKRSAWEYHSGSSTSNDCIRHGCQQSSPSSDGKKHWNLKNTENINPSQKTSKPKRLRHWSHRMQNCWLPLGQASCQGYLCRKRAARPERFPSQACLPHLPMYLHWAACSSNSAHTNRIYQYRVEWGLRKHLRTCLARSNLQTLLQYDSRRRLVVAGRRAESSTNPTSHSDLSAQERRTHWPGSYRWQLQITGMFLFTQGTWTMHERSLKSQVVDGCLSTAETEA